MVHQLFPRITLHNTVACIQHLVCAHSHYGWWVLTGLVVSGCLLWGGRGCVVVRFLWVPPPLWKKETSFFSARPDLWWKSRVADGSGWVQTSSGNPCLGWSSKKKRASRLSWLRVYLLVIANPFTLHAPFILFLAHPEWGVTTWWPHDSPVYPTWSAQPHRGMGSDPRGVLPLYQGFPYC